MVLLAQTHTHKRIPWACAPPPIQQVHYTQSWLSAVMNVDVLSINTLVCLFNDPLQTTGHQELMSLRLRATVHVSDFPLHTHTVSHGNNVGSLQSPANIPLHISKMSCSK